MKPLSSTNNLPLPLTSFVGQAEGLARVREWLAGTRLLTLTGPGGVGKTRLALEAARSRAHLFESGAWWVELAAISDPALVVQAVALTLGLPEDPTLSQPAALIQALRDQELLLVLDGCEHLIAACAHLAAQLLPSCPRLHVLATSREPLGVGGERVWMVPPLSLPCPEGIITLHSVMQSDAGQLFVERALAIQPDLALTEAVVRAIAQVCCQLDGIPLAIELAAARVRVLTVPDIAAHLDDRFRLLGEGHRTALSHHQTIKATIGWSYDLLSQPEQRLFERLAVFAGGWGLAAARAVAGDPAGPQSMVPAEVLDLLSHLVHKSLVALNEGEQLRYRMLETIRHYAWDRLSASGEMPEIRDRHLAYYLELAREAEARLAGPDQVEWLHRLELEHDNLRAALAWSQESGARAAGLRLATALAAFWLRVGYLTEGSGWLRRALADCREVGPVRMRALYQAGRLARHRGDYAEALALARQSLALARHLRDRPGTARALGLMGWIAHWQGDRNDGAPLLEKGLALARASGDERATARMLLLLGEVLLRQRAQERAGHLLQESLGLFREMGDGWSMAWALYGLGEVARLRGDHERAVAYCHLSLSFFRRLDSKLEIPYLLEALALSAADQDQFRRAARLWGAASAVRDTIHAHLPSAYQADYAPAIERVRLGLGKAAFSVGWAEGRVLTLDQAFALAAETELPAPPPPPADRAPRSESSPPLRPEAEQHGLTPREVEVLRQVAAGLTDAQIAAELVISPRTVGKHLQSIYSKLYLSSRSAATRWAVDHRLV